MADYDLAIVGGSMSSRLAARMAVRKGARVALVAPGWQVDDATKYTFQALYNAELTSKQTSSWSFLRDWVHGQCEQAVLAPAELNALGIDVILEPVSFTQDLRLKLENRHLKASRYLLTDGYTTSTTMTGLPCHRLIELKTLPAHIVLIGHGAAVVEWAYALSHIATVTLILSDDQSLLPAEDQDIQRLVEAQLKSLGIRVVGSQDYPGGIGRQSEAGTNELLVCVPQPYDLELLALENIGVTPDVPIMVNPYLQTRCSLLYATGGSLGGENRPELTQQEIAVALENVLFGWRHVMRYECVFYSIQLLSLIGRWGLTECQARRFYGSDIKIFQASCLPKCAKHVAETNFCKLITLGKQIVGLHLMGDGADILVAALGKHPNIRALSQLVSVGVEPGTLQDAIYQVLEQWQHCRWSEGQWRRDWAENWFNFRRSTL